MIIFQWTARHLKMRFPDYKKIVPYTPFHYYLERKLYIHNMAHVTTAFLGKLLHLTYIDEAAGNIYIRKIVQGCMTESAMMLSRKYHIDFAQLQFHIDDLLFRFRNPYLKDTVERVTRDPVRKLGPTDRLVGSARSCEQQQIEPVYLSFAIALGLYFLAVIRREIFLNRNVRFIKMNRCLTESCIFIILSNKIMNR